MNPWIRRFYDVLLFAYPREFREQYRSSINDHLEFEAPDWPGAMRGAADVLVSAISMRVENLWRDLSYAVRMNAKAPLFTLVIVCAIALAIAVNTVVFALLDAVLLKPLPFENPSQIGLLWQRGTHTGTLTFTSLGTDQVRAIVAASKSFASVGTAMQQDTLSWQGRSVKRIEADEKYFSTLGVHPILGRFFTPRSSENEAVISYALWRAAFAGGASVLGSTIRLDSIAYRVVGVAPPGMMDPSFGNLLQTDVWTPMPRFSSSDQQLIVFPIVRLRPGATWAQAQSDLDRIKRNLKGSGAALPGSSYYVGPISDLVFGNARAFFWMVFAAVTGVLLVACANIANLLLVRAAVRQNEFSLRNALGASPRRIASQVFVEAGLLAAAGAILGLIAAALLLPWAKANIPGDFPRIAGAQIDWRVLSYAGGLLVAVALVTGMIPAYRPRARQIRDTASRLRAALVVIEVAVAFALTTGFGLLLHSFLSLTGASLGFSPDNVYAAMIKPDRNAIITPAMASSHPERAQKILTEIRAIPGVEDAAVATAVPFQNAFMMSFLLESGWNGKAHAAPPAPLNVDQVSVGYLDVMRIPLVSGRWFASGDFKPHGDSAIVNQSFARTYFPGEAVVGKRIRASAATSWRIVGVVGDTRSSLKQSPSPLLYLPYNGGFGPYYGFAIRTSRPVASLASQLTGVLQRTARGAGSVSVSSLDDLIAADAAGTRTSLELLGALAALALLLGLCGIYSVVAYSAERRFHEIGIRMAVGAEPGSIVRLIVGSAMVQGLLGVACGLVLCAMTTRLLSSELYSTSSLDPSTLLAVTAVMLACTAAAALVPACRAALARPAVTLRYE